MIEMSHSKIMTGTASEALKTENFSWGLWPPDPATYSPSIYYKLTIMNVVATALRSSESSP